MLNTSECATVTGRQRENQRSLTFQHSATVLVLAAFVSLLSRSPAPQDESLHEPSTPAPTRQTRSPADLPALQARSLRIGTYVLKLGSPSSLWSGSKVSDGDAYHMAGRPGPGGEGDAARTTKRHCAAGEQQRAGGAGRDGAGQVMMA